jgi:hypothetical protein
MFARAAKARRACSRNVVISARHSAKLFIDSSPGWFWG